MAQVDYTAFMDAARKTSSIDPAHDMLHVKRVLNHALHILEVEPADAEIVIPAILLHELFNYPKGHPDSKQSGDVCAAYAAEVLDREHYPHSKREYVLDCIRNHSFSKGIVPDHLEGKVVQDADRLDAIGAVGIARLFATCSEMGTPFYCSNDPFGHRRSLNDKQYGLDHFYVKLFHICDSLHTDTARQMAVVRTEFMESYIAQLQAEIY